MAEIGIIGSGIAGLHLGLSLQRTGIPVTLYAERTPEQLLTRRLSNMVARNACTRARERLLGVNHWDRPSHDMGWLSVRIGGARAAGVLRSHGAGTSRGHADLLRASAGGFLGPGRARGASAPSRPASWRVSATRHDLLVVASGRATHLEHLPPCRGAIRPTPSRSAWWSAGCSAASAIPSRARSR